MDTISTSVIFKNPWITTIHTDSQYSVSVLEEIASGVLVLIEHVVYSPDEKIIAAALAHDDDLYRELFPRSQFEMFPENVDEKMRHNMFSFESDGFMLGRAISKFNHNCNPNCCLIKIQHGIYGVWTLRPVRKGDELCIDYLNGERCLDTHQKMMTKHNVSTCSCDEAALLINHKKSAVRFKVCQGWLYRDQNIIDSHVSQYKSSQLYHDIEKLHGLLENTAKLVSFV